MITLRPIRKPNRRTAKTKPTRIPKHGNKYPQNGAVYPLKKNTNVPKPKIAKRTQIQPIRLKPKNPNSIYNNMQFNQRQEVIKELRKGSILIPLLFSTRKPDPKMSIEKIGVSRAEPILNANLLAKYTKNIQIIQLFEGIVTHKLWAGLENYEKQKVFSQLDNLIQRNGETRFTEKLIDKREKQQKLIEITLNKARLRKGIDFLAELESTASIKSVIRHRQKVEKHNTIERRKLLNEISKIQEDGKKVINPKNQREIINLLMSEKSAFISNAVLKKFITTRAGVFVLVNWIKMEKGDRVFQILTKNPKLRYSFSKYITTPVGLKRLNHALSTPPRRNFFSRAILLAEEFKEHEATFKIVEQFIKDPTLRKLPKLEKTMPKDLAKFLKQAMHKLRDRGF